MAALPLLSESFSVIKSQHLRFLLIEEKIKMLYSEVSIRMKYDQCDKYD